MNEPTAEEIYKHCKNGCKIVIRHTVEMPNMVGIYCETCQETLYTIDPLTEIPRNDKIWYQKKADDMYGKDGEIEIDEGARLSPGDEGAYVQAWVWVPKPETEEA